MANTPTTPKIAAKGPRAAARPKLAANADAPDMDVVEDGDGAGKGRAVPGLRLKELVDRVVAATGGKKKGVKEVVEATLTQLGAALQKGESLNLPEFGKMRVARAGTGGGGAMTLKLRRGPGVGGRGKSAKEAIAADEDQD